MTERAFRWMALACLVPAAVLKADGPGPSRPPAIGPRTATAGSKPDCDCDAGMPQRPTPRRYTREAARYRLPEVTLIDADGNETRASAAIDHDGPVVLQFVFTTCPTICGALSGSLASVRNVLGDELSGTHLVSISIDPEHDRPAQLRGYAEGLKAGPDWRFYTGGRDEIAAIQKAFDAHQVNKMGHQPLTFLRPRRGAPWVRLTGLLGAADLAAEFRAMVKP